MCKNKINIYILVHIYILVYAYIYLISMYVNVCLCIQTYRYEHAHEICLRTHLRQYVHTFGCLYLLTYLHVYSEAHGQNVTSMRLCLGHQLFLPTLGPWDGGTPPMQMMPGPCVMPARTASTVARMPLLFYCVHLRLAWVRWRMLCHVMFASATQVHV